MGLYTTPLILIWLFLELLIFVEMSTTDDCFVLYMPMAHLFFLFVSTYIPGGIYYGSYIYMHAWSVGVVIFLLTMASAFLGYVLPWGQMSFWGATVITNLFSAIPYIGNDLVQWI